MKPRRAALASALGLLALPQLASAQQAERPWRIVTVPQSIMLRADRVIK